MSTYYLRSPKPNLNPFCFYLDSRRNPAKRTEISAIAIDQSNISLRSEILAEGMQNILRKCRINNLTIFFFFEIQ